MSVPATISHAVQQMQVWLKSLCESGGYADESEALAVLRAVLHQLRDRLTLEEAVDLGAQLPLIVRGIYYEGWRPSKTPQKLRSLHEFLEGVSAKLVPHPVSAEPATRDVFSLLAQAIDSGEIGDVINQLPVGIKELWPEGIRTWATKRGMARDR
jgi:uncharacterized protein (DUF2267 family)